MLVRECLIYKICSNSNSCSEKKKKLLFQFDLLNPTPIVKTVFFQYCGNVGVHQWESVFTQIKNKGLHRREDLRQSKATHYTKVDPEFDIEFVQHKSKILHDFDNLYYKSFKINLNSLLLFGALLLTTYLLGIFNFF